MKIYHTATQEDYDALMIYLEEKGFEWLSGHEPTFFRYWEQKKENTCIVISAKYITFMNIEQSKKQHPDTPIIEFKAKGENMTQKEMKYNLQEIEPALQEAKSSAKKLIEKIDEYLESQKPKFEVGDYVVDERLDYMTKIKRISNGFVYGSKIYDLDDSRFGGLNFGCPTESIRQPKPEEIAEYKSALTFHKHGRKPFEVRKGDLIEYPNGQNIMIYHPDCFSKTDFLNDGFKLLKTAEEVNEWLENK